MHQIKKPLFHKRYRNFGRYSTIYRPPSSNPSVVLDGPILMTRDTSMFDDNSFWAGVFSRLLFLDEIY